MEGRKNVGMSLLLFSTLIAASAWAVAVDSVSAEFGSGNKTRAVRFGVQSDWNKPLFENKHVQLAGYWDFTIGYWRGRQHRDIPGARQHLIDIGIAPVLRLQSNGGRGLYGEIGVGPRVLSERYDNNGRRLSTHFQFGSHLGIGYQVNERFDIAVKYQHISNASIKSPNSGVEFTIARATYRF